MTREVASRVPGTAILALTPPGDGELVVAAMLASARGVLSRSAGHDDLVRFIRGVAAGAVVFGERAADRLYGLLAASQPMRAFPRLTAPKTVRNVVSSIHAKAGTDDREVLLAQARDAGLGHHS
ncbi:hypothetical protein LCL61_00985 [Amycolatopsis coloradensis]|uniref:Uncharacterized protein n=1 Tax=Amycolatopsis coloradensis TaxID=76021 RepID=A0ACD5B474_9PSEU